MEADDGLLAADIGQQAGGKRVVAEGGVRRVMVVRGAEGAGRARGFVD